MSEEKTLSETVAKKLKEITDNVPYVYQSGVEAGRKAEYDAFWDAYQQNGTKTNYSYAFSQFTTDIFYPKYDFCPTNANYFTRDMHKGTQGNIDLVERLRECGIKMDFSKCKTVNYLFYNAPFSRLPELDLQNADTSIATLMFGANVETIDKFIIADGQQTSNTFGYCSSLKNIVFEGVISSNINFSSAKKLSLESAKSAISCLKNYSGTENEGIYSIKFSDNTWSLLDAEGNNSPAGTTWREYIGLLGWGT